MPSHHIRNTPAAIAAATVIAVAVAGAAHAQPAAGLTIGQLKTAYLQCENAAHSGRLGNGGAMQCSLYYEELKQRAFGGSFSRLKEWYDSLTPGQDVGL
jgi:hypothetical protein